MPSSLPPTLPSPPPVPSAVRRPRWKAALLAGGCAVATLLAGCAAAGPGRVAAPEAAPRSAETAANAEPSGRALLARYVDATGGTAAYEALTSRVTRGEFEASILVFTATGTFVSYQKQPHMLRTEITARLLGREFSIVGATDGAEVWQTSGDGKITMLDGPRREAFIRQADLHLILEPDRQFTSIESRGRRGFEDADCYEVETTTPEGDHETRFYRTSDGLLAGMTTRRTNGGGDFKLLVHEYRDVDGILEPVQFELSTLGAHVTWSSTTVEHNVAVDDALFTRPTDGKP